MSPLGLTPWAEQPGRWRHPLQNGDYSRNDPRLVPGFIRSCSEMFPEQFRNVPELANSEEIRHGWTEHAESGSPSYWAHDVTFCHPAFCFFRHLSNLLVIYSGNGWILRLAVPRRSYQTISNNCSQFFSPGLATSKEKLWNSVEDWISLLIDPNFWKENLLAWQMNGDTNINGDKRHS